MERNQKFWHLSQILFLKNLCIMNADKLYITTRMSTDANGIVVFGKFGKKSKFLLYSPKQVGQKAHFIVL